MVRPVTVAVVAAPTEVAVKEPGEDVTVYPVIAEPPLSVGAVHVIVAFVLPPVATTEVGAPDTVAGVTGLDAVDAVESPTPLVAMTVNV